MIAAHDIITHAKASCNSQFSWHILIVPFFKVIETLIEEQESNSAVAKPRVDHGRQLAVQIDTKTLQLLLFITTVFPPSGNCSLAFENMHTVSRQCNDLPARATSSVLS